MFKRMTLSAVGGAGVSVVLAVVMSGMIAAKFTAKEKTPNLKFDIKPIVEEPVVRPRIQTPDDLPNVEIPPALPEIEKVKSARPSETIGNPDWTVPEFDTGILTITGPIIHVVNSDPQPVVRYGPVMPSRATKSGHCDVRFNINASGKPFGIEATYCSQSLFKSASIKSVQKWNYRPEIKNGAAVSRNGLKTKIRFVLKDERDQIIPE